MSADMQILERNCKLVSAVFLDCFVFRREDGSASGLWVPVPVLLGLSLLYLV